MTSWPGNRRDLAHEGPNMLTDAPCLYCDQPLHLTLAGWLHPDGQNYAPDGHCGTPNRDKASREEKRAGRG
ncbi:unnamed protein product, partial [marine sediment metagenome]